MQTNIPPSVLDFLNDIQDNNNREWFNKNKERYLQQYGYVVSFADALIKGMHRFDNIDITSGKNAVFRIYRDVRFSKDKNPYKDHIGGFMSRSTKALRGGYYFHIEPGKSFVEGGFWGPEPADLKLLRDHIAADDKPLRKIISDKNFITNFGGLKGEKLKSAPKGFRKDHPAIDLLNHKQFLVLKPLADSVVTSPEFLEEVVHAFRAMRPFFDYMSEILTTDLNGVSLIR